MEEPNVILVVLDSVRADHLSLYGYERPTSPFLEELAERENVKVYKRAYSTSSWTPPAHASLFTGFYPSNHGVVDNLHLGGMRTIDLLLAKHDYETVAFTEGSAHISEERGFLKGVNFKGSKFDPNILDKLSEPFYLFANLKGAHRTYNAPRRYVREFAPNDADMDVVEKVIGEGGGYDYMAGNLEIHPKEWKKIEGIYDAAIRGLDESLEALVAELEEKTYGNTAIIITADHGEEFGEHSLAYHQFCLYNTLLHVPLLVKYPKGMMPRNEEELVSLADVFPTVLDLLGEESRTDGISLLSKSVKGRNQVFAEYSPAYAWKNQLAKRNLSTDRKRFHTPQQCVITERWKYIEMGGNRELYDLESDSGELHNLAGKRKDIVSNLRDKLSNLKDPEEWPRLDDKENSEKMKERLKELGYLWKK